MRVIVADDEVLLREGLARLLVEAGFEVIGKAGDAAQLLSLVERRRPDLAVVDIKLPPTTPTRALQRRRRYANATPRSASWSSRTTSSRVTRCACSNSTPKVPATY
jgi:DNA-binding NarL/FixJ family response regulator